MSPNNYFRVKQRKQADAAIPVIDAVRDFLATVEVKKLQPGTRTEYEHNLLKFAEWCAKNSLIQNKKDQTWSVTLARKSYDPIMLHRVNDQAVHLFLQHLAETSKPSRNDHEQLSTWTFANYVKCIKRFLNWCLLDEQYCEHIKAITVQRIQKPKIEETIIQTFSPEQLEALFDACDKEESDHLRIRDKAILALLLDSGIRATELCTLTIGNTDLSTDDPHIKIFGKGQKWGEVGMGENARRAIARYIRQFREPTIELRIADQLKKLPPREAAQMKRQLMAKERVFVNRAGKPLTKGGLLQLIGRLGDWAGIEGVRCSPHDFRHTFARMFMENGGNIFQLSKILRHTSVKTTENYLKSLMQSEVRKGAKSVLDSL
jgi:integrase/recombinase XerD